MKCSLKFKIISSILAVVAVTMAGIFVTVGLEVSRQATDASIRAVNGELHQVDNAIALFLEESKQNTDMLASFPTSLRIDEITTAHLTSTTTRPAKPDDNDTVEHEVVRLFQAVKKTHPAYVEVFVGTEKGAFVSSEVENAMPGGYDPRTRPWYKEVLLAPDEALVSKAYQSTTGVAVASVMRAVKRNGQLIGCMGVDISLEKLTNLVQSIRLGATGYMVLIQDDGVILADPRHEANNFQNVSALTEKHLQTLFEQGTGHARINMDDHDYIGVVLTSPKNKWRLIGLIERAEIMAPVYSTLSILAGLAACSLVLLAAAIWFGSVKLVLTPLMRVVESLNDIGHGRYDKRIVHQRTDEMGTILDALNDTADKLGLNAKEIAAKTSQAEEKTLAAEQAHAEADAARHQAEQAQREGMMQAATRLERISKAVTTSATELSSQIDESSRGAEHQALRVAETATAMEEMNATVMEVAKNAGNAANTAGTAHVKALEGAQLLENVVSSMNDVQRQTTCSSRTWAVWANKPKTLAVFSLLSPTSPIRPISLLLTQPLRRPKPETQVGASPWWPTKCANWPKKQWPRPRK